MRYDDAEYAHLAQRAGATDERARERLYRDATMLHAAGALRDVPYLRVLASAREPLNPRVWLNLANEYERMDLLVRDTPEARVLATMQRKALGAFVLRYDRVDSRDAGPFRLGYDSADALVASGDAVDGAAFRDDYARLLDGATATNFQSPWLIARLSAADATAGDVQRTEASLRANPPNHGDYRFQQMFLENVGDEALGRRVLSDAMADGRLTSEDPTDFLFTFGKRHPGLALRYLRDHLRAIVKGIPPTQQAWTLSNGVASSLWPAASPRALERFLRSTFPTDRGTVAAAVARIERSWSERRALLRALREVGPARRLSPG